MNRQEALRALAEGKKVRACSWQPHCFIFLNPNVGIIDQYSNGSFDNFAETTWELYEEPKRYASSLEEALRAEELHVEWPDYTGKFASDFRKSSGGWRNGTIAHIHAALALGCKIEIVR